MTTATAEQTELHPEIQRKVEELERRAAYTAEMNGTFVMLARAVEMFDVAESAKVSLVCRPTLLLFCAVDDIKDLASMLRWFGTRGYRQYNRTEHPDLFENGSVVIEMRGGPDPFDLHVALKGSACRFVKVGQKTEDVYELKCGD